MKTASNTSKKIAALDARDVPEMQQLKLLSKQMLSTQDLPALAGAISGHLAGFDDEGRILFKEEQAQEPCPVVIGLSLSDDEVAEAAHLKRRALVIKTSDKRAQYVLVALLRERISAEARAKDFSELKTHLSGKAIDIGAKDSLELHCGRAKITLHADGRIEINGDYLLSRSRGPIKLKGATIDIN